MKYAEVIEAERNTHRSAEIRRQLRSAGYRLLGSGADATVWAKKGSADVVKIIMPDHGYGSSQTKYFKQFYDFCQAHSDLANLPKFKELNEFVIDGMDYTMVAMERLKPIPVGSFQEAMVWILSDLAVKPIKWPKAASVIKDPKTWEYFDDGMPPDQIIQTFNSLDKNALASYGLLFTLMALLYQTGRINKLGWDLHTENVMQRADGTLVIVDPWFAEEVDL